MKEKIFEWANAYGMNVKQVEYLYMGGIETWYVHVYNYMIHEVDFKAARRRGFYIEAVEVMTTIDGKFEGLALWINEIKGE